MNEPDWNTFLQVLNGEVLESEHLVQLLDTGAEDVPGLREAASSGWLGRPGATEEQIVLAEQRLGVAFPPSYRTFLSVSNGWYVPGLHVPRLWPAEELERFAVTDQDTIDVWSEGDPELGAALTGALRISDMELAGSAIYLLYPGTSKPGEEWEASLFAYWIPGENRFPSFRALLESERQTLLQREAHQAGRMRPADTVDDLAGKLPNLIEELRAKARLYRGHTGPAASVAPGAETAEALDEVAERVEQLQSRRLDARTLIVLLHVLKQELDQGHRRAHERWTRGRTPLDLFRAASGARALSRAEGHRQGAALIGWFIEDAGT